MIKGITVEDSEKIMERIQSNDTQVKNFEKLNPELLEIRKDLLLLKEDAKRRCKSSMIYEFDLLFSLNVYKYFNEKPWFNETTASNYDFWREIQMKAFFDVIMDRFTEDVNSHLFDNNLRMYLPTCWWYIHLSWQGDVESTYEVLKDLTTDYIQGLVERPHKGYFLEVTRSIMYHISKVPTQIRNQKINGAILFRRIMIINTARDSIYNLSVEKRAEEYVIELFKSCGVEVETK